VRPVRLSGRQAALQEEVEMVVKRKKRGMFVDVDLQRRKKSNQLSF